MVVVLNDGKTYCMNDVTEAESLREIISEYCGRDVVNLFDELFEEKVQAMKNEMEAAYEQMEKWERIADGWRTEYQSVQEEIASIADTCLKTTKQKTNYKLTNISIQMLNNL